MTDNSDIEIYIKACEISAISDWLSSCFVRLDTLKASKKSCLLEGHLNDKTCPISIMHRIDGDFSCVWFKNLNTPWQTDIECARAAALALGNTVRCDAGGWNESQGLEKSEQFLEISAEGETVISW